MRGYRGTRSFCWSKRLPGKRVSRTIRRLFRNRQKLWLSQKLLNKAKGVNGACCLGHKLRQLGSRQTRFLPARGTPQYGLWNLWICPNQRSRGIHQRPHPALPCPALPCPALPCPALPCPALPCPALPCPALPCPALPCTHPTHPTVPRPAPPRPTSPRPTPT